MGENTLPTANRNYKDTLFRMIFNDEANLLSLYNLMSGKEYTDPKLLTIVTLENAIYMNMKNDLAFIIDCRICMYEHQSTYNPNMPLRNLFYVAREYEKLITTSTLYSSKQIALPAPDFIVFYNGENKSWDQRTSKLSDSFAPRPKSPQLELIVKEININIGIHDELFQKCKPLFEYMQFVEKARTYKKCMSTSDAVYQTVDDCMKEGILKNFLQKYKSEAIAVSIFEFDQEKEMKYIRRDEREIGREEGIQEGIQEGMANGINHSITLLIQYDLSQNVSEDIILQKITTVFGYEANVVQDIIQKVKLMNTQLPSA